MLTEPAQDMFQEVFGNDPLSSVSSVLTMDPSSELSAAWTAVDTVYNNIMVPIALGLMVIWFLVKFMERATSEQVTLEQTFLLFVKLIAAKFLIDHGLEIFTLMWSLGISLINTVGNVFAGSDGSNFEFVWADRGIDWWKCTKHGKSFSTFSGVAPSLQDFLDGGGKALNAMGYCADCGDESLEAIHKMWESFTGEDWGDDLGTGKSIGVMFQLLLPWLVTKILIVCVSFVAYSRLIEMLLRMCGAPIALSDFMSEGLQGAGWRYLKSFFAICLQGILIVIIAKLYSMLMLDVFDLGGFWPIILAQFSISFASIALMFKSLTISKELLGVS